MDPAQVKKLQSIYGHVDDVDLFVGGFLERDSGDSPLIVGTVFKCIIGDTFARCTLTHRSLTIHNYI